MLSTKVALLLFNKGYHVGWRDPRRIVDHTTILRALIYTAYLTEAEKCIEKLSRGELEASALLPAISVSEKLRLLAPFPKIPCLGKAAKIRGLFVTLSTLKSILNFIANCVNAGGIPIAQEVSEVTAEGKAIDKVITRCIDGSQEALELKKVKGVACRDNECDEITPHIPEVFFSTVGEYRNRIDRLSGVADVFEVYAVKSSIPLWLILRGDEEAIRCGLNLLEILQRLGIGGLRSRGWGKFKIITGIKMDPRDEETLTRFSGWVQGYNYILGLMPPGKWLDVDRSYATREITMGRSGSSTNEYRLPIIYVMDLGSVVYVNTPPKPQIITLDGGRAVLVFNPVVIHA